MASVRREQAYAGRRAGKAPSERPAFQPYRGKLAVRNDRGDRGNVGIIRSPVRASILPDLLVISAPGTALAQPTVARVIMQFQATSTRSRLPSVLVGHAMLLLAGLAIPPASAQSVAGFYNGKNIIIYVGFTPGGSYD